MTDPGDYQTAFASTLWRVIQYLGTENQYKAASMVRARGQVTAEELGEQLDAPPSTVSTVMGSLMDCGLVEPRVDPDNRRRRVWVWSGPTMKTVEASGPVEP